ncbi:biotin--[acetyl-CoA-carboxylase] ligase [Chitinophagaceae bacterium MMS25-I14]
MAPNFQALSDAPIIELDTIDSTNNYAMRIIDADTAQPGLTIVAKEQTSGKGQRGRTWTDTPRQSVLMSIIVVPKAGLDKQFVFNASVAAAIAESLQDIDEQWDVRIKWPNDIIVNDKKTGGILIENVLRGSQWLYSIIGLGVNVLQESFPDNLPNAGSLKTASGKAYKVVDIQNILRNSILKEVMHIPMEMQVMERYNTMLYRINQDQAFADDANEWLATVLGANADGRLEVQTTDGRIEHYVHGAVQWLWAK